VGEMRRILVIDRDSDPSFLASSFPSDAFDVVRVRTIARALHHLRGSQFEGVFVCSRQLPSLKWAGWLLQSEEILEAIADGVALVDPDGLKLQWVNPEFTNLVSADLDPIGRPFYEALGNPTDADDMEEPFDRVIRTKQPAGRVIRLGTGHYFRLSVTPILDPDGGLESMIALTRDVTDDIQQQYKIQAINNAGEELADLTPDDLSDLSVGERIDLLKYNISRHMRDLLGLDYIEIRLLRESTKKLEPILTEGMTPLAADRELYASETGNGVTGYVAATGKSYLCRDATQDPLYLEGAADARSSLTVPLVVQGKVIGTLNVESAKVDAFDHRDQLFLEIYARNIASAINTLNLLEAEKVHTATASIDAIAHELALPLDDILGDATTALDRYAGHDDDIIQRLRHLLNRAREIRGLIRQAGATIVPESVREPRSSYRLSDVRVLVVDAEEAIRQAAHQILDREGATVETAHDAAESIALARQTPYTVALVDIRLPDLDGYETFRGLRAVQPNLPVILMTGFGYDPTHSIVKARKDGLRTVVYKPFQVDRLIEAIEQAARTPRPTSSGDNGGSRSGPRGDGG